METGQWKRDIDASEAAVKAGRVLGPFNSVSQVRQALKDYKAKTAAEGRSSKKQNAQRAVRQRAHARNFT